GPSGGQSTQNRKHGRIRSASREAEKSRDAQGNGEQYDGKPRACSAVSHIIFYMTRCNAPFTHYATLTGHFEYSLQARRLDHVIALRERHTVLLTGHEWQQRFVAQTPTDKTPPSTQCSCRGLPVLR